MAVGCRYALSHCRWQWDVPLHCPIVDGGGMPLHTVPLYMVVGCPYTMSHCRWRWDAPLHCPIVDGGGRPLYTLPVSMMMRCPCTLQLLNVVVASPCLKSRVFCNYVNHFSQTTLSVPKVILVISVHMLTSINLF